MHRLLFAGCSFTHNGDSWAHQGQEQLATLTEQHGDDPTMWTNQIINRQNILFNEKYKTPDPIFTNEEIVDESYYTDCYDYTWMGYIKIKE